MSFLKRNTTKAFFILLICVLITGFYPLQVSASPSLNLSNGTVVLTDDIKVLSEKHNLVSDDVTNIYIINLNEKIDILYKTSNGTIIKDITNYNSDLFTIPFVKESHLQITKNGVVIFSGILHESNYGNIAKYLMGKNAQTPELARTNMFLCFIAAIILAAIFIFRIIEPLFDDIERQEI